MPPGVPNRGEIPGVWQVVLIAMIAITFALGAPPTSSSRSRSCSALSAVTTMLIAVPIQERMGGSHNGRPALHQVFIPGAH